MAGELSHLDERGAARMVDVSAKAETTRTAVAEAIVRMQPATLALIQQGGIAKGDVFATARLAGIMAAKRTPDRGQAAWAPLFATLKDEGEARKPGLAATIGADLERLAKAWPQGLPQGIIHEDYFPDNVFFSGGKFAGAIDFYFACVETLAYDIAVALNAWCFEADGSFNITSARALVAGYETHRPLSAAERQALPVLAHGAAMRFFLTRLEAWGSTPAGALVRPKDPLEYERKLAVHRAAPDLVLFGDQA